MGTKPQRSPLRRSIELSAAFVALLWAIKLLELLLGLDGRAWALLPREFSSLVNILSAPLVHGSPGHLLANSLPTLLLGSMLLYGYPSSRWRTLAIIWAVSGLGVWLLGRPSYHLGVSGITHGLFFFLLVVSVLRRDLRSIGLMLIACFMYGGMLLSIFPRQEGVSFEYHFFGALGGVLSAWLFRERDPRPRRKRYAWEDPDADDQPLRKPPDWMLRDRD